MDHIAQFLKDIHFRKKTGHLSFRKDDAQKSLYFQDGDLIFAKTNVPDERLGEILFHMGKISMEAFRAIPQLLSAEAMLGETLIKKKYVTQKDLYEGLVAQMTAISLSLFPYFDAEIYFRERGRFFEESLDQKMNVPGLIERGIREMPYHPALEAYLENKVPVAKASEGLQYLTEEEKVWLDLLEGQKTGRDLLALHTGNAEEFWKMLYLLDCLDILELRDSRKEETEAEKGRPCGANLNARLQEVLDLRTRLPEMDDYKILGVPSHADEAEIKKAYFQLARRFHPDSFGRDIKPECKSQIDEVFDYITKAYRSLLNKGEKPTASSKATGAKGEVEKDRSKNAEIRYRQGKTLFNQGRYEEAVSLMEEAVRLKDDKGDYYLLLALAQSKIPALSKRAEKSYVKAVELEPWNPEGLVGLGLLYKREGLLARAKKQFEKAVEVDPEHKTARQELRILSGNVDEKKGLMGILTKDLFGSKKKQP